MSELIDVDSDGNQQYIWLQDRADTCGPACVYMIERIKMQACPAGGETRIRQITELLPEGYSEGHGTASFTALALALRRIGIPAQASHVLNFSQVAAVADGPFIARVRWPNGAGHFVVCAGRTANGTLVSLDPWYGLSEPKLNSLPVYSVSSDTRSQVCLANPIGGVFSGHIISPRM